jgi:hypothetical protein
MVLEEAIAQVLAVWNIPEAERAKLATPDGRAFLALLCNAGAKQFAGHAPALYALKPHLVWHAALEAEERWYVASGPMPEDPLVVGGVYIQTRIPVPWAPPALAQFGFHVHGGYDWPALGEAAGRTWAGHIFQTPEAVEALLAHFAVRRVERPIQSGQPGPAAAV